VQVHICETDAELGIGYIIAAIAATLAPCDAPYWVQHLSWDTDFFPLPECAKVFTSSLSRFQLKGLLIFLAQHPF
jgi:hypothetical protein